MFVGYIVLQLFYSYNLWSKHVMVFPTINRLHSYFSTLRSACAVPSAEVFCSSLNSCFRGVLLRYLLNCFDLNTFAPVVTGISLLLLLKLLISRYWIELNYRHIHEQIFSLNHSFLLIIILFVLFVTWCDLFLLCPFWVFVWGLLLDVVFLTFLCRLMGDTAVVPAH